MKNIANLAMIKSFRPKPLTQQSHEALSKILRNFTLNNTYLICQYKFTPNSYLQIVQKMNRIGLIADQIGHHPQWTLHGDKLFIGLTTHQIGNEVSLKDYILGYWIQQILNQSYQRGLLEKWNKLEINYN